MTESVQRILIRRGLAGAHLESVGAIITALEATAAGWNAAPTPSNGAAGGPPDGTGPTTAGVGSAAPARASPSRSGARA